MELVTMAFHVPEMRDATNSGKSNSSDSEPARRPMVSVAGLALLLDGGGQVTSPPLDSGAGEAAETLEPLPRTSRPWPPKSAHHCAALADGLRRLWEAAEVATGRDAPSNPTRHAGTGSRAGEGEDAPD